MSSANHPVSSAPEPYFPSGLLIYFRTTAPDASPHTASFPDGRTIELSAEDSGPSALLFILNHKKETIGIVPISAINCLMPLQTVGPAANANH